MKIKRSSNHHESWMEKDKNLRQLMSKQQEKKHNKTFEDFERRNIIDSMSACSNTIDKHIDNRFMGIKRRAERSREKHKR